MVQWVVGSTTHGGSMDNWYNKGHGMSCPDCGMVHIKEPLLLIGKCSLSGSLSYVRKEGNVLFNDALNTFFTAIWH